MACAVGRGLPDGTARAGQCDHEFGSTGRAPVHGLDRSTDQVSGGRGSPPAWLSAQGSVLKSSRRRSGAYEEVSDWTQQKVTDWRETHENCVRAMWGVRAR